MTIEIDDLLGDVGATAAPPPQATPPPVGSPPAPLPLPPMPQMAVQNAHVPPLENQNMSEADDVNITTIERMFPTLNRRMAVILGMYITWWGGITALAWISSRYDIAMPLRTCSFAALGGECVDAWTAWWTDGRLWTEVVWGIPFILVAYVIGGIQESMDSTLEDMRIPEEKRREIDKMVPNKKWRITVLFLYYSIYMTVGAVTHFDILGIGGAILLLPIYWIQGILVADAFSLFPSIFITKKIAKDLTLDPLHEDGCGGMTGIALQFVKLSSIPAAFAVMLAIRSWVYWFIGGESVGHRLWGEVAFLTLALLFTFLMFSYPLLAIISAVIEKKLEAREQVITLAGLSGLRDLGIGTPHFERQDMSPTDALTLLALVDKIREAPINLAVIMKLGIRIGPPALLATGRVLIGL